MATVKKKVKKAAKKTKKPVVKKKATSKTNKPKKTLSRKKVTAKAKKSVASKKKLAPAKKRVRAKIAKEKKSKPKVTRKLSITELFNNVHKQLLEEQQNLRHLEHHPHNLNKGFKAQKNGFQMSRMSRNMNLGRGKK